MKTVHTLFIIAAFIVSIITACQNPADKAKGNYQKDMEDTTKKPAADSAVVQPRVNPEDTVRKY